MRTWPPFHHVIFDFDSTLSTIEGIDVLAENAGVAAEVAALTRQAMDGSVDLETVYARRLSAIRPTRGDIRALRAQYAKHLTPDAELVVRALTALHHRVYIVSGGLVEPIIEIGASIGVARERIRAVDVEYDEFSGDWWLAQTDEFSQRHKPFLKSRETELEKTHGKAQVIRDMLTGSGGRSVLIGDGASDLAASHTVDLFVGFTGVVEREPVKSGAPMRVTSRSLAPVLAIAAGFDLERRLDSGPFRELAERCYGLIEEGALVFNDPDLEQVFTGECRRRSDVFNDFPRS